MSARERMTERARRELVDLVAFVSQAIDADDDLREVAKLASAFAGDPVSGLRSEDMTYTIADVRNVLDALASYIGQGIR